MKRCRKCNKILSINAKIRDGFCFRKCKKSNYIIGNVYEFNRHMQRSKDSLKVYDRNNNIVQEMNFYETREWKELRYLALRTYGPMCQLCGATKTELHVDHIKPRSKFPELQLKLDNLQILCRDCNLGKSNLYADDWRK
jgi:5-methylcytosine-specific restriction endonuclease McrA